MKQGARQCQNCKKDFAIEPDDFAFYEKIKVPSPTWCPECRMMRRLAHRNERTLYRRICDSCKKESVSIYPLNTLWPVYCNSCWWGDSWDAKSFAMEYDFGKSFFEQFKQLQSKVPRISLLSLTSVNSEYTNNSADNKNCYLIFAAEKNEDCMYGRLVQRCKSVVDVAWVYDSELCYECLDIRQCHSCMFCERCQTSTGLLFCFDVKDSNDCILSTNLRHAQFYIENKKYSKEDYLAKRKEILSSRENIEAAKKRFEGLKSRTIVKYAYSTKCVNATGDFMYNCYNSRLVFDASNTKDCAYMADAEDPVDFLDGNNVYYKPERCVEIMGTIQSYNSKCSTFIFYCNSVEYSDNVHNSNYCLGCIGLRKSQYCILNKQYTKEEYEDLYEKIVKDMKDRGEYGNFFPAELSPFKYNETLAKDYYPNPEAQEIKTGTYGAENGKDIFACTDCKKNFKITAQELDFYKHMNLPLPLKDFECRMQDRLKNRNPRKLWHRKCMCDYKVHQNSVKHSHHTEGPCPNEFETSYAPGRPEIVYCEQCYQAEVA